MSHPLTDTEALPTSRVGVHPDVSGVFRSSRRVEILGSQVGKAYRLADLLALMRAAELDPNAVHDPEAVDWQGDGPDTLC